MCKSVRPLACARLCVSTSEPRHRICSRGLRRQTHAFPPGGSHECAVLIDGHPRLRFRPNSARVSPPPRAASLAFFSASRATVACSVFVVAGFDQQGAAFQLRTEIERWRLNEKDLNKLKHLLYPLGSFFKRNRIKHRPFGHFYYRCYPLQRELQCQQKRVTHLQPGPPLLESGM